MGELAASHHGVITRTQACELGLDKNDIAALRRSGVVESISRSVLRFTAYPVTWRQTAYAMTVDGKAVACGRTAAALHRLDGCDTRPATVDLLVAHSTKATRAGVTARRSRNLTSDDTITIDGIVCTTIARTICDLAEFETTSDDTLVRMIDDAQRRGVSMRWLLETAQRLRSRGRRGPARVLRIVERRLNGYVVPGSWFERLLRRCLRSEALKALERQYVLRDSAGSFVARFDLAVPWLRLGIEGHSRSYHVGERNERADEDRDLRAAEEGWEVVYLGFAATKSPAAICTTIERIALRRMRDLGLSLADTGG